MAKTKDKAKGSKPKDSGKGGGLSVKTFGGLNSKRYSRKGDGANRIKLNDNKVHPVQFVAPINDEDAWVEIEQHQFREDGKWNYVPCLGDECPLCEDEDGDVSKTTYRFFTNVWDFKEKQYAVLEGPKTLSAAIARKFTKAEKSKKGSFLKKTYELTRVDGTPITFEVDLGDERAITIDPKKLTDLHKYVEQQARYFYGDNIPSKKKQSKKKGKSALDDDDADAQSDEFSKKELKKMDEKTLQKAGKVVGVKKAKDLDRDDLIAAILKRQAA